MYRYSVLVTASALALVVSGAIVTGTKAASPIFTERGHIILAVLVGVLTLGLVLRRCAWGWIALGVFVVDGGLGWTPALSIVHATLAPVFFSVLIAIVVFTSPGWQQGPEIVEDPGASSLRFLALATPPLVLMQIVLGALYRHQTTGVLPHMGGAMVVSLLTMIVSMIVIQRFPGHRSLNSSAVALLTIVLVQVSLGITAFILRLLENESTPWFVVSAASHVTVGALTLAASVVLAMQIRRNVRPAS